MASQRTRVIAITTDFGLEDPYVGVMKGVILGISPDVRLVDVTHGVMPQDVLAGCLMLEAARPYFPPATIHLAVVDPGVGTRRAGLVVEAPGVTFVAPDNGLLSFLRDDEIRRIRRIENRDLMLQPVSRTFHGRDVFAPVAAHLAAGVSADVVGPEASGLCRIPIPGAVSTGGETSGELLTFDRFGNGVTSIRATDLPGGARRARIKGFAVPLVSTYGDAASGSPLCLVGSSGRLEISVRDGSARADLDLRRGDALVVGP
jgi:S-adenosylmethionine hydrolase